MLVRGRLLDRLRDRWFVRVTVLSAPAGYGKTTLLAQAIAANDVAPMGIDCWLACGPASGAVTALGLGLCQAVDAVLLPADRAGVDEVAAAVTEALWRRSPQQVALFVDDVHEIPPESEASKLLALVVASLPANGHVVLAGRLPPALPLARLEVEGRVARLDESDLVFSEEEVAEFAALRGVPSSRLAACGGWPALAELSASTGSNAAGEYLSQEVLAALAPTRRRQLALLTHLGAFDEELAGAALDATVDVLELLAGLPLVTVVAGGERLLHPLWRSLLAGEVTPAEIAGARRRAAAVLLERRDADAAIPLLIAAEAWDDLREAIVTVLGAAHPPVPHDAPAEWYARLPAEVRADPGGRLLAAVVMAETDAEGAWDRFEECAAEFRAEGSAAGEVACLVQLARLAWWSEEPDRLAGLAIRVLELEAEGCEEAVALACVARALLFDLQNDSRQMLAELDRLPAGSLSEAWEGVASWLRSLALLQLGDAQCALEAAEQALAHAGDLHVPLAEGTRLQSLWYQGRIAETIAALPGLRLRLRKADFRNNTAYADAQCSVAYALGGELDRAAECLAHARTAAVAPDAPLIDTALAIAEAALAVAAGDDVSAATVLTACLARHPLGQGLSAAAQLRNLALVYVLAPATRPGWDRAELGPVFLVARDLARAVVGVRERHRLPADVPPLPEAAIVRAHLPLRWAAELAVAAVAAGRDDGWELLGETWPAARPAVMEIARDGAGPLRKAAKDVLSRLPVPPTGRLELRLLGPIELRRDGALVDAPDWRRERARSLLAYLALHGTTSRERLAGELWPELDADASSRNLRVTQTYLLRVLEPHRRQRDPSFFVRQHGGNISLHPGEWLTVDIWEFDALCEQADNAERRGSPAVTLDRALRAAELWRSEPAELLSEPWAVAHIEQRRHRFAALATRSGELLLAQGNVDGAHALAERALDLDPWLEAAHRLVVAAHHANGHDIEARRALHRYQEAIHDLGFSPSEATSMVERLLNSVPRQGA